MSMTIASRALRLFAAAAAAALAAAAPAAAQTRYMRVYYIQYVPVGSSSTYGECQYYEFPGEDGVLDTDDDRNLLIDGGRGAYAPDVLLPFLDSRIGKGGILWFMANSSAGEDHYDGLRSVLARYDVRNFYQNFRWTVPEKGTYEKLIEALDREGCGPGSPPGRYFEVDHGDYLSGPRCNVHPDDHPYGFDPYVEDKIIAAKASFGPWDDNYYVLVHQFRCGGSVFLSGGDAPSDGPEKGILDENPDYACPGARDDLPLTDIYKVHHHGSAGSSSKAFLDLMGARYAVAQMAYGKGKGSHDHPTADALHRIWQSGAIVYRNDLDGTVLITCDNLGNYDITRERVYVDEATTPGASGDLVSRPPAIPQNLRVTGSTPAGVHLEWDEVPGAYGYDVFRSTIRGGDPGGGMHANPGCDPTGIYAKINVSNVDVPRYTDASAAPGATYYYRVSSKKVHTEKRRSVCYERRYSNEAANRTPTPTPTATPLWEPMGESFDWPWRIPAGYSGSSNTSGFRNAYAVYAGCPRSQDGPDTIYRFYLPVPGTISASLTGPPGLSIFLCARPSPEGCAKWGRDVEYKNAAPGLYYLAVDGPAGSEGPYEFTVAVGTPAPTPAPPAPTPVATPRAEILLNGGAFGRSDVLRAVFKLNDSVERRFTAYAAVITPGGEMLDAITLGPSLRPVASGVERLPAPFEFTILSMQVPEGAPPGEYGILAAFFDAAGRISDKSDAFLTADASFTLH